MKKSPKKPAPAAARPEGEPKYDVAISFLARDERIAAELNNLLGEGLKVFFFPGKQEELAGTDGLESMREPFLTARVMVILYREPWGETPWTRVEEMAIKDHCLAGAWDGLLFVQLDNTSKRPSWLPTTHIRFALEQYGIDQLAGAVKLRVQERGGKIAPPTALGRARQVQQEASLIEDQKSLFRDVGWIATNVHREIEWLMGRIAALAAEIKTELGMKFDAVPRNRWCVLRDNRVTMRILWRQPISNSVSEQAEILATEYSGLIFAPDEGMMVFHTPKELRNHRFKPALSLSRDLRWTEDGKKGMTFSADDIAHRIVILFLDLLSRADKGQIDLMHL